MSIREFKNLKPQIHEESFIAESVDIIGDVVVGKDANLWYGAVLRGDIQKIVVGDRTNIQDNSTVHVGNDVETIIGDDVTIGHNCVIHGCTIGNNVLVGMGSVVLNNAVIGENTIIGAGSLVTERKQIPSGVLCLGSPAKVVRELTVEEIEGIKESAKNYVELSKEY